MVSAMLTPPSRHLKVMQQNVAESKALADALREQNSSERGADRANVQRRKEQMERISKAHRERETFLLHVRALFEMSSPKMPAPKLPGPLQRVPLKAKTPAQLGQVANGSNAEGKRQTAEKVHAPWSEVSTAAPSTVGGDDDISFKAEDDLAGPRVKSVKPALPRPLQCENNSLKELEIALTRAQRDVHEVCSKEGLEERDVLDETLSSSDESFLEVSPRVAPATSSTPKLNSPKKVQSSERSSSTSVDRPVKPLGSSKVQRKKAVGKSKSRLASGGLKSISKEEEALQKSLLRMDFEEMKRQFSGQKPLWRDNEAMGESFKTDPHRESKLEASLLRLDEKFHHLHEQHQVRLKKDQEQGEGKPHRPCQSSVKSTARTRPRSSVGRTYSTQRRWRVEPEVPTIHAGPRGQKQGDNRN